MDPKEYAARLQRMRDEMETAKARERIQAQSSRELSPDTNREIEAAMAALREDRAGMLKSRRPELAKAKAPARTAPVADAYSQDTGSYPGPGGGTAVERQKIAKAKLEDAAVEAKKPAVEQVPSKITPEVRARVAGMPPEKALSEYYNLRAQININDPSVDRDIVEMARMFKARADAGGAEHGKGLKPTVYVPRLFGGSE